MKIELENAIKVFHPSPSYEQVYFEAVANSLDANANEITINISIESFDKPKSGVADLRYESSFVEFLKPRLRLTLGYVQNWHS